MLLGSFPKSCNTFSCRPFLLLSLHLARPHEQYRWNEPVFDDQIHCLQISNGDLKCLSTLFQTAELLSPSKGFDCWMPCVGHPCSLPRHTWDSLACASPKVVRNCLDWIIPYNPLPLIWLLVCPASSIVHFTLDLPLLLSSRTTSCFQQVDLFGDFLFWL